MHIHCKYDALVAWRELKPHPKNHNIHPADQVERLAKLIQYQGVRAPIVVSNLSGFIVKGHGTLLAMQEVLKESNTVQVPVVFQDFTDIEQEYAFVQSDNAIALWAELDLSAINSDLADLGPDFDIDLLGIKNFELEPADKEGEDEVPEPRPEPTVKLGELYQLGNHYLLCGDSTNQANVARLMGGSQASLIFTDPPYGVSYVGKTKEALTIENDSLSDDNLAPLLIDAFNAWPLAPGGSYYVCSPAGNTETTFRLALRAAIGLELRQCLVWVKQQFVMGRQDYHWRHESILYGWKEGAAHYFVDDRTLDTVWEFDRPKRSTEHPTMKPVELVQNALMNSSKKGDIVFDGFCGSGTTIIAAEKTNRKCRGSEIDPRYCDVIIRRWMKFTGQMAYLMGDENGELKSAPVSFAELDSLRSMTPTKESKSIVQKNAGL